MQIIAGIIGRQAVGAAVKQAAMRHLPKIISGGIGGIAGGMSLGSLCGGAVGDPASGGALGRRLGDARGGAILTEIVGAVVKSMNKQQYSDKETVK